MSVEQIIFLKGEINMIYAAYYFLGFASCLLLLTIIVEVNDREKKNKKERKRNYRRQIMEQEIENEKTLQELKDNINIDIKVY